MSDLFNDPAVVSPSLGPHPRAATNAFEFGRPIPSANSASVQATPLRRQTVPVQYSL
jgi:hypothetical protein